MLKLFIKTAGFIFLLLSFVGAALAGDSVTKNITASINPQNGLDVHISKVTNGQWPAAGSPSEPSIAFGTLAFDTTNHIFLPDCYFAVDVGVNSNAADWTVTHTISSMVNQSVPTANLDHNVIVTFAKTVTTKTGTDDTVLSKVSFAASNGVSYGKSALSGGWLRIYYGIATGDLKASEPPDVSPVTTDTPAGYYVGSVTITLTP